ncbi:hypothetical protein F4779DRAFT_614944 [Xylariaceae sp. FL0662B]|nr:hypothetical protein F4779DRAFT_614944 [Xylariaceae sp. FL0662B]
MGSCSTHTSRGRRWHDQNSHLASRGEPRQDRDRERGRLSGDGSSMGLAALPFVSVKGSGAGYKKMSSTARRWRVAFTWPILLPVSSAVTVATPGSWLLAPALGAGLRRREQQSVLREHGRLEKYGSPNSETDAISEIPVLDNAAFFGKEMRRRHSYGEGASS